jgi:hypothetical protein
MHGQVELFFVICTGIIIPMAVMPGYPAGAFDEDSD